MTKDLLTKTTTQAFAVSFNRRPHSAHPRRAVVRHAVATWRWRHPELRGVITESGLCAAIEREQIYLYRHGRSNRLMGRAFVVLGQVCVMIHGKLSGLAWQYVLLHELGHVALHMDPEVAAAIRAENPCDPYQGDDGNWYWPAPTGPLYRRHEAEAELFADLLLGERREAARAAFEAFDPFDQAPDNPEIPAKLGPIARESVTASQPAQDL